MVDNDDGIALVAIVIGVVACARPPFMENPFPSIEFDDLLPT